MTHVPKPVTLSKEAPMRPDNNTNPSATTPGIAPSQATDVSARILNKADLNRISHLLAMHGSCTVQRLSLKALATDDSAQRFNQRDLHLISGYLAMHHHSHTARMLSLKAFIAANIIMGSDGIMEISLRTSIVAKMQQLSPSGARKIKRRVIRQLGGCRIDRDLVRFGSRLPADPRTQPSDKFVPQLIELAPDEASITALKPSKKLQDLLDYQWDTI